MDTVTHRESTGEGPETALSRMENKAWKHRDPGAVVAPGSTDEMD